MNLSLSSHTLSIELEWYEQLLSFCLQRAFDLTVSHIERVTTEEPMSNWAELRAPGTFIPGIIKAGTYYTTKGKEFWYVTRSMDYLTLELRDEPYRRIILTVDYSQVWAERISAAIVASL